MWEGMVLCCFLKHIPEQSRADASPWVPAWDPQHVSHPAHGPPACGSVAQWQGWVPQPATVMSKTIQDVIQGLIPPALTHLSLLPLFFLVPNEVRDLWQKASTVAKLLQQHTCVVSCWLFFFPLKYLSNPYISYNAESQDPISLA